MPRYVDSDEYDDEYDFETEEEDNTAPCPFCGVEIYDDSEVCPHCKNYIIMDESRPTYPSWVFWTALILLILILSGFTCLL